MSNSFAIAAVTEAIGYLLDYNGVAVSARPPDAQNSTDSRVNIFLYQVTPNPGYRELDAPARASGGELVRKQRVALDLHYLLTAYGSGDDELAAQRTLAEAVRVLHENPVLARDLVEDAINNPVFVLADIESADLAEQVELVKVTMQNLSLEDLTKIWSSFFKTGSYRISVAYKATVVLLDGKSEPRPTMPVRKLGSYVYASCSPQITYVDPQMVPWTQGGATLKIVGRSLKADQIRIDFGTGADLAAMPEPDSARPGELQVTVPDDMAPGIKQVRVLHPLMLGEPEEPHRGLESNTALFAVVPVITEVGPSPVARGDKLTVKFRPAVARGQDIKVILSTYMPLEPEWPSGDPDTADELQVIIPPDYEAKELPVRIRVDGVESQPDAEEWDNEFGRPAVEVT
jgi:hypothetical protein